MNVLFIASVAVVAADPPQSRKLFIDALGLPLEGEGDGYYRAAPSGHRGEESHTCRMVDGRSCRVLQGEGAQEAVRSWNARVTAAVRLETCSRL
jgi:hypothetical protein